MWQAYQITVIAKVGYQVQSNLFTTSGTLQQIRIQVLISKNLLLVMN